MEAKLRKETESKLDKRGAYNKNAPTWKHVRASDAFVYSLYSLFFGAVGEVAGIAETRYDIAVGVDFVVDDAHPQLCVLGHDTSEIVDSLTRRYDGGDNHLGGGSLSEKRLVAQFHGCTGGQHGVAEYQGLAVERRRCEIFDQDVEVLFLLVFAVGRHESVLSIVEVGEEALVEGYSRAEDSRQHYVLVDDLALRLDTEGRFDFLGAVAEGLAHLVGEYLAKALEVAAEAEPVGLYVDVAHVGQVLAHQRRMFGEVDYFHVAVLFVSRAPTVSASLYKRF